MTFPLWPATASGYAGQIDLLLVLMLLLVSALSLPVFVLLVVFAARYREGAEVDRSGRSSRNLKLELSWAIVPFLLTLIFFVWAAKLYFDYGHPPADALEISVLAKQWMWKFQHPGGQREINELHVPAGTPVKLTMISEDVIHSLFLPALRIKHDVLPGRYSELWFTADRPGTYHLLCAEFCGTDAFRDGRPDRGDGARRLRGLARARAERSLARRRRRAAVPELRLQRLPSAERRGPGAAARRACSAAPWRWPRGEVKIADEAYLRDSILLPRQDVVAGYQPIMPSFQDRISEAQLVQLIAYLKSLGAEQDERR